LLKIREIDEEKENKIKNNKKRIKDNKQKIKIWTRKIESKPDNDCNCGIISDGEGGKKHERKVGTDRRTKKKNFPIVRR
jgi:hypothetical protein